MKRLYIITEIKKTLNNKKKPDYEHNFIYTHLRRELSQIVVNKSRIKTLCTPFISDLNGTFIWGLQSLRKLIVTVDRLLAAKLGDNQLSVRQKCPKLDNQTVVDYNHTFFSFQQGNYIIQFTSYKYLLEK